MTSAQTESAQYNGNTFPIAIGLAIAFAVVQLVFAFIAGLGANMFQRVFGFAGTIEDGIGLLFGAIFIWCHALFVLLVTDASRAPKGRRRTIGSLVAPSLGLGAAFVAFGWLDASGSAYSCGDGQVIQHTNVPMLPWLWIGWLILTLFAVPSRLLLWSRVRKCEMMPIPRRVLFMLLGAVPVWFFGYVFENHTVDCSAPRGGWGVFEGGLVAFPLLGLFLFSMSTSMAMLSGLFARPNFVPV